MSDPITQLKNLKTDPNAGWVPEESRQKVRATLMEAIGEREVLIEETVPAYTHWIFSDFISKPLAASVAVFVLLLGGWMTTVNAASNSLPGDTLYGVKLVTEAAQLKLASSERKAILHTEFAERRLDEAVGLSQGDASEDSVREAMNAFKTEVARAETAVRSLQTEGRKETVAVAYEVDQKINVLTNALDGRERERVDANDAEETTREVSDSVVEVMVETHETAGTPETTVSLENRFREGVADIKSRQTYDLGRLAVIRSALEDEEILEASDISQDYLNSVEFSITHATDRLSEAMDVMANGGVRSAFDILITINQSLENAEANITELEIRISVAASQSEVSEAMEEETDVEVDLINSSDESED